VQKEDSAVLEREVVKETNKVNKYYLLILFGFAGLAGITFLGIKKLAK